MRAIQRRLYLPLVFAAAVLVAGCSDGSGGRMEISGSVKLVGQPIEDGTIVFKPLDKQDTQEGAQIVNGEYKIPRKQGLKPGKYLVQISSGDGKTPVNLDPDAGPGPSTNFTSVDRVPPDWNVRSKREEEVKSNGPNKFNFEIPNYNPQYKPPR
jgi:hypothetical protein